MDVVTQSVHDQEQEKAAKDNAAAAIQVHSPEEYKDLIKQTFQARQKIADARSVYERQWLTNIAFLYGRQYFTVEKMPKAGTEERIIWELKALDKKKKTRKTVNYILPLYRSILARMLQMKQRVMVDPLTNQDRDISGARVGQEVLEDLWLNINSSNPLIAQQYAGMPLVLAKLFQYMLIMGRGHLFPYFNPKGRDRVYFRDVQQPEIRTSEVGCVEMEVDHPFNVYIDPLNRFKIQRRIMSLEEIEAVYKVIVKPDDIVMSDAERQLVALLEGKGEQKYDDCCEVLTKWEIPSAKYPDGRVFVCTKDQMLSPPMSFPAELKGRMPIIDFDYLDFLFGAPQGMVEQLIPSQEDYNFTVSRLADYKKYFAGKVLAPSECELQSKWDDQTGQIIKYNASGGKPEFVSPPNPPSFLTQEILRVRNEMQDIAASHDASQGRTPKGITANAAIESLAELDQSQLTPQLLMIETKLSHVCDMMLDIVEARYSEPRLIGIAGKPLAQDVRTFLGTDVASHRRIKVSLGSQLPVTREARQEKIQEWLKMGIITKDEARNLLEFGDFDGIFHSIDDSAERMEIQEMLRGVQVEPMAWENHARRIKVITDFMMGEDFKKMQIAAATQGAPNQQQAAETVQRFITHRQQHQQFLSAEMQQIQGSQPGSQPPPPAGPPA